jgi:hypothetical protein
MVPGADNCDVEVGRKVAKEIECSKARAEKKESSRDGLL